MDYNTLKEYYGSGSAYALKTAAAARAPFVIIKYTRRGDYCGFETFETETAAAAARTRHGLSIGLRPEPSADFALYPTVWKLENDSYKRLSGY